MLHPINKKMFVNILYFCTSSLIISLTKQLRSNEKYVTIKVNVIILLTLEIINFT